MVTQRVKSMEIFLNKEPIEIPENQSIRDLVLSREILSPSVAVAVNMRVIRKEMWEKTILKEGDKVVIICATKGG